MSKCPLYCRPSSSCSRAIFLNRSIVHIFSPFRTNQGVPKYEPSCRIAFVSNLDAFGMSCHLSSCRVVFPRVQTTASCRKGQHDVSRHERRRDTTRPYFILSCRMVYGHVVSSFIVLYHISSCHVFFRLVKLTMKAQWRKPRDNTKKMTSTRSAGSSSTGGRSAEEKKRRKRLEKVLTEIEHLKEKVVQEEEVIPII
jgi:hypothetical protein